MYQISVYATPAPLRRRPDQGRGRNGRERCRQHL